MSGVDGRSVGELILDADITARGMLWDADPQLAKAQARTWGEVIEAAAGLWAAIPDRTNELSMARVHQLATRLHRSQLRAGWPGPGPADPHLESITNALTRAAELVSAHRDPTTLQSYDGHLDSEAARARLMHTVYVCTHAVGLALGRHTRGLQQRLDNRQRLAPGDSLRSARSTWERLGAAERLAGSYLHGRWPAALVGEQKGPTEPARLEQALARWDVQAHRTLAAQPTTANLYLVARVQRDLAVATCVISAAAAGRGVIDARQHTDRVQPVVSALEHAWGQLGTDLSQLVGRQRHPDHALLLAGAEVHAALRDITHDRAGLASPATMAGRVDLATATASLQRSLTTSVDLAHAVRDALADPDLTVGARGAHAMVKAAASAQTLAAAVPVGALHHDRQVTPPHPVRVTLLARADHVIDRALAADSAAAALDPGTQPPARAQMTLTGRSCEDRAVSPAFGADAPGFGCER